MSHFYGIHPWQWELLTYEEVNVYVRQYDEYLDEVERSKKDAQRQLKELQ